MSIEVGAEVGLGAFTGGANRPRGSLGGLRDGRALTDVLCARISHPSRTTCGDPTL